MKNKFLIISILLALTSVLFNSCIQDEGYGGNSNITGIVMEQTYNSDQTVLLKEAPAKDEDVFLIFGDASVIGDDAVTSFEGKFEFKYLWPGDYAIYCYSDTLLNSDKVEVSKTISIDKGETKNVGTIYIKKIVDWDEGNSSISGSILKRTYNEDLSILLSETIAKDEDVFLKMTGETMILDDVKTSSSGSFQFQKLWPGSYTVFSYSDTALIGEKVEVATNIELSMDESVNLGDIAITNIANWDEGSATITGLVMKTNYKGTTINDIGPAQEQEIYIAYNGHDFYDDRIRTGYDGKFEFNNLILGDYLIYVYSDNVAIDVSEKIVKKYEVTITDSNQTIDLGTISINQK